MITCRTLSCLEHTIAYSAFWLEFRTWARNWCSPQSLQLDDHSIFHLKRTELCGSVSVTELRANLKHPSGRLNMALDQFWAARSENSQSVFDRMEGQLVYGQACQWLLYSAWELTLALTWVIMCFLDTPGSFIPTTPL